jgi:transposase
VNANSSPRTRKHRWKRSTSRIRKAGAGSLRQPPGAAIYDAARARGKDHPHAVPILARAWIYVLWRCWQSGTACDPAKHNALQRVLEQQDA